MTRRIPPPDTSAQRQDDRGLAIDDPRLRQALRELPPDPAAAAGLAALQRRVLAQWQAAHAADSPARPDGGSRLRRLVLEDATRRRWLLGSGLLLGALLVVLGLWLHQPDPGIDELLQPDVLSQMAIGQM